MMTAKLQTVGLQQHTSEPFFYASIRLYYVLFHMLHPLIYGTGTNQHHSTLGREVSDRKFCSFAQSREKVASKRSSANSNLIVDSQIK
jgi:hypothetical protein